MSFMWESISFKPRFLLFGALELLVPLFPLVPFGAFGAFALPPLRCLRKATLSSLFCSVAKSEVAKAQTSIVDSRVRRVFLIIVFVMLFRSSKFRMSIEIMRWREDEGRVRLLQNILYSSVWTDWNSEIGFRTIDDLMIWFMLPCFYVCLVRKKLYPFVWAYGKNGEKDFGDWFLNSSTSHSSVRTDS